MSSFKAKIITPNETVFDGEIENLVVRAASGDVCILANHTPYVSPLGSGKLTLKIKDSKKTGAVSGGLISVSPDKVTVFTTDFIWKKDIDVKNVEKALKETEEKLTNSEIKIEEKQLFQNEVISLKNKLKIANM